MSLQNRSILAFPNTDEIFAVSMQQRGPIPSRYLAGLILLPFAGWAFGTFIGAAMAGVLPAAIRSALGIAIYGMFLAIIIPPAKHSRRILLVLAISAGISCLFAITPILNQLSSGWVIIICAFAAAGFAAWKFPMPVLDEEEND